MKKIINCLITLFLFSQSNGVLSQGVISPSPDAMALIRQASMGVNYYSGSNSISIPIAAVSGRELSVNASLNYNAFGHRVQDVASSEGLGWSLNAGGFISRIVRGEPDGDSGGFCMSNPTDTEPDLFIFSIMGRSGKFVLNDSGEPVMFPYQPIQIKPGVCSSSNSDTWEIIDENGNVYQFGLSTLQRETTTSRIADNSEPAVSFVSTWYLSKVISPNGTDQISFSYGTGTYSYLSYFFKKDDGSCAVSTDVIDLTSRITVNARYLTLIQSSGGNIYFDYENYREDLSGGKYLKEVRVLNADGDQVNKMRFSYSYFGQCSDQKCKRLRLDSIHDVQSLPLYSFDYFSGVSLPARDSPSVDYMGLYNNYTGTDWIPYFNSQYPGSLRNPDSFNMKADLLTTVNQRGGGYTTFYYEPNSGYKDGVLESTVSGNRVYLKVSGDGNGNIQRYFYDYETEGANPISSGILFRKPIFGHIIKQQGNTVRLIQRFSHSTNETNDLNGIHIGYSRVVERVEGLGSTTYEFTNYDNYPDIFPSGNGEGDEPPYVSLTTRFWERGNLLKSTVKDESERILSQELFEYDFDTFVKETVTGEKTLVFEYDCSNPPSPITGTYQIDSKLFFLKKKISEYYDQNDPLNAKKLTSIEEYTYNQNTGQLSSSMNYNQEDTVRKRTTQFKYPSSTSYNYSSYNNCLNLYYTSYNACEVGDESCVQTSYSNLLTCISGFTSDEKIKALYAMKAKGMIGPVIETRIFLSTENSSLIELGTEFNLFRIEGGNNDLIVPDSKWVSPKGMTSLTSIGGTGLFVFPNSFRKVHAYNEFDLSTGVLYSETSVDGINVQYKYAFNNTLVDSTIQNPGLYEFISSVEHVPLVGVSKEIDVNNSSVNYEYDLLGRQRLVIDQDQNIIQRTRYHNQYETPNFLLESSVGQAMIGQNVTFRIEDIFLPAGGDPTISWDMGNGLTYNDNREQVTLSYNSSGVYLVEVTLESLEFTPVTKTLAFIVSAPMSFDLCVDGPQEIDLCGADPVSYGGCTVNNTDPFDPSQFHVNFTNSGCTGIYTYVWEYKESTSPNWTTLAETGSVLTFPGLYNEEHYFLVRCTITDACNNTVSSESYMLYYKSTPSC